MRTQIVSPTIGFSKREANDGDIDSVIKGSNKFSPDMTGVGFSNRYSLGLPYSINIFASISKTFSIESIVNPSVNEKVMQILNALNESIANIPDINNLDRYLAKLHLVEQEDKSILIEWIYKNFRIGFVVCEPVEDSYYFFVSHDDGTFVSKSVKINDNININSLAQDIVQYVVRNT